MKVNKEVRKKEENRVPHEVFTDDEHNVDAVAKGSGVDEVADM